MTRTKGSGKIQKLGTNGEVFIHRLKAEGYGYRAIANKIKEVFGVQISHDSVKRFLKESTSDWAKKIGYEEMQQVKRVELEKAIEVESQLKELNNKLQSAINTLDSSNRKDMKMLVELTKEVREQLRFHKQFIEEVTTPQTQINLNKTQIAIKVSNELEKLEQEGIIEIKKPDQIILPNNSQEEEKEEVAD